MKIGAFDNFELFASFPERERRLIESLFVVVHQKAGHVFMREGDRADATRNALYLVVEGQVRVTGRRPSGNGFAVNAKIGAGELFGVVGLVADAHRSATCTAITPVVVAHLDRVSYQHLHSQHTKLGARFELMLARQLVRDLRRLTGNLAHALETGETEGLEGMFNAAEAPPSSRGS